MSRMVDDLARALSDRDARRRVGNPDLDVYWQSFSYEYMPLAIFILKTIRSHPWSKKELECVNWDGPLVDEIRKHHGPNAPSGRQAILIFQALVDSGLGDV